MNRPTGSVVRPTQRFTLTEAAVAAAGGEGFLREAGRNFMLAMYGALRNLKLYPPENAVVQTALADLVRVAEQLRASEGDVEFRVAGEFIFVNGTRLRLDLDNLSAAEVNGTEPRYHFDGRPYSYAQATRDLKAVWQKLHKDLSEIGRVHV